MFKALNIDSDNIVLIVTLAGTVAVNARYTTAHQGAQRDFI
jgi:hypothetical protein